MPSSIQSDQNMRWNAARRKRNKSRFEIRERIKDECSQDVAHVALPKEACSSATLVRDTDGEDYDDEQITKLKKYLEAISLGSISFFSLQILSKEHEMLSKPISTKFLSRYKIQTLCTSRFGPQYACDALAYVEIKSQSSMFEYSLMLGEYGIAYTFIAGGINPCDLIHSYRYVDDRCKDHGICYERVKNVSALVMKKLVVDFVPPSLAVYIAKCVFDLRMASYFVHGSNISDRAITNTPSDTDHCQLCSMRNYDEWPLLYLPFSDNTVCELCLWEDLMNKLDERIEGNVFRCPVSDKCPNATNNDCGENIDAPGSIGGDNNAFLHNMNMTSAEKCQLSLKKFQSLPKDSIELKKKLGRKSKKKMKIHSSWKEALIPTIGFSQDVRSDKFKRYVDMGAVHHCRTCLECGVDINSTNEYNQSPLYLACWKNHVDLVELLLQWGADISINANGFMSPWSVAVENNHKDIVQVFQKYSSRKNTNMSLREKIGISPSITTEETSQPFSSTISTLIHDDNHPGYGAFYIDNFLHNKVIDSLDKLHKSIPIAKASEVKKKKIENDIPCSLRHNFCDSEGHIRKLIGDHITMVLRQYSNTKLDSMYKDLHAYVFAQMKFLNYDQPGGELLPHVDLTKVDILSGKRSTHTFILYLSGCEMGGETALLKKLSNLGPQSFHEIIQTIAPQRNRILIFPHSCPHSGKKVVSTPKILLRGEVLLTREVIAS